MIIMLLILYIWLKYLFGYIVKYKFRKNSLIITFLKIPCLIIFYKSIKFVEIVPYNFKIIKLMITQLLNYTGNRLCPNCVIIYANLCVLKGIIVTPEKPEEFVAELTQRIALSKINDEKK